MIKTGSVIRFNANSKSADRGKCVVNSIYPARTWIQYSLTVLEGKLEGQTFTYKVRKPRTIDEFATEVRATKAKKEEAKAAGRASLNAKYEKEREGMNVLMALNVQAGDIVRVTIDGKRYDRYEFNVHEVDYAKLRIKGFHMGNTNPGAKMGWVNVAHESVTVEMVQKGGFNPATDAIGQLHTERKAQATAKRNATRARRQALRNIWGF